LEGPKKSPLRSLIQPRTGDGDTQLFQVLTNERGTRAVRSISVNGVSQYLVPPITRRLPCSPRTRIFAHLALPDQLLLAAFEAEDRLPFPMLDAIREWPTYWRRLGGRSSSLRSTLFGAIEALNKPAQS